MSKNKNHTRPPANASILTFVKAEFQNLIQVYIHRNSCLISSCMNSAMLTMLYDNIQLQKEFNVHKKIWRKFWKSFYTVSNLLNFQILCIWINKADFIYGYYCSGKWWSQKGLLLKTQWNRSSTKINKSVILLDIN